MFPSHPPCMPPAQMDPKEGFLTWQGLYFMDIFCPSRWTGFLVVVLKTSEENHHFHKAIYYKNPKGPYSGPCLTYSISQVSTINCQSTTDGSVSSLPSLILPTKQCFDRVITVGSLLGFHCECSGIWFVLAHRHRA